MNSTLTLSKPHWTLAILVVGYAMLALFLAVYLQHNFLQSDVFDYWEDSLAWQTPYHPFHVPAYPLTIALLRGITFGALPPAGLLMTINLVAFLASAYLVFRIIQAGGGSEQLAALGTLVFGCYPFVGLTYTVVPLADLPSMFFLLSSLYLLQQSRRLPAAVLLGLALVTHKAMWVFVGPLVVADFYYHKQAISKKNLQMIGVMLLPITILWIAGSFHHQSITWIVSSNLEKEVASKGSAPVFDGLIGTFMEGGAKGMVKGIVLLSFAAISAFALMMSVKLKYEYAPYGIAIAFAVFLLFVVLNEHEIWAAMRFGRLLAIPLALMASTTVACNKLSWWRSPVVGGVLLFAFLSQFAYSWYLSHVYFG